MLHSVKKTDLKSIHIKTFGCQMNVYDSDRMGAIFGYKGFRTEPDLAKADVILLNTCSIRDKAEQKVLSLLGQLKPLKAKYPNRVIGVTGCVGQRMGRTLLQRVPHLDFVIGPDSVERIGVLVDRVVNEGVRVVESKLDEGRGSYSQPALPPKGKPSEFLTVMKGCDHFCTYCIVPFVRGREKSRPISELLNDVSAMVEKGTREITFLGQNINTYGKGTGENLAMLVEQADKLDGLERIRYVTSHPWDLREDLISQFGTVEKLCPALHLPFQAGSDKVLKRMSRLYTRAQYLEKADKLRKSCPDIALSTDVIVGFPGETDEDFSKTLEVLRELRFSYLFLFKYSPRPGTKAYGYAEEEVPESIKDERLAEAQQVAYSIIAEQNQALVGSRVSCLMESLDKKGRFYMGRTLQNKVVHVLNAGSACVGKTINVEITEANGFNLKGFHTDAPRVIRKGIER